MEACNSGTEPPERKDTHRYHSDAGHITRHVADVPKLLTTLSTANVTKALTSRNRTHYMKNPSSSAHLFHLRRQSFIRYLPVEFEIKPQIKMNPKTFGFTYHQHVSDTA